MSPGSIQLVVGLGNPGAEYRDTRHNVGFMVLDHLAQKAGVKWESSDLAKASILKLPGSGVRLLKPLSFMNRSGVATQQIARYFRMESSMILVVLDDIALPLGRLRFRDQGSHGGHNGLGSILQHLGTQAVPRLRAGIAPLPVGESSESKESGNSKIDLVPHVLGKFQSHEIDDLNTMIKRAAEAVLCAVDSGLETAKNQFNGT